METIELNAAQQSKRKQLKSVRALPKWFDLAHYSKSNRLDLYGWLVQLYLRQITYHFSKKKLFTGIVDDYQIKTVDIQQAPSIRNLSWQDAALITEVLKKEKNIPCELWSVPSALSFKNTNLEKKCEFSSIIEWCSLFKNQSNKTYSHELIHPILDRFFTINREASDEVLISDFKLWLKNKRKKENAQAKHFSNAALSRWSMNQILPYIDLTRWSELTSTVIPHWLMGEALFPGFNQGDKSDRVRKTTEKTAEQLMQPYYLYAMAAQLSHETGKIPLLDIFLFNIENASIQHQIEIDH